MRPGLTEEEIKTLRSGAENKLLKESKIESTPAAVTLFAGDLLSLLDEVESAREARMPETIVSYNDGEKHISYANVHEAELEVQENLGVGAIRKAVIYCARVEEIWILETIRKSTRIK